MSRLCHGEAKNSFSVGCKLDGQQGRVVRKPVNANPGLKVNWPIDFSCTKMFFTSYISYKLRLLKLKTEGQTM